MSILSAFCIIGFGRSSLLHERSAMGYRHVRRSDVVTNEPALLCYGLISVTYCRLAWSRMAGEFLVKIISIRSFNAQLTACFTRRGRARIIADLVSRGRPSPPSPVAGQDFTGFYIKKFNLKMVVEVGSCICDLVEAVEAEFEAVYSIKRSADEGIFLPPI